MKKAISFMLLIAIFATVTSASSVLPNPANHLKELIVVTQEEALQIEQISAENIEHSMDLDRITQKYEEELAALEEQYRQYANDLTDFGAGNPSRDAKPVTAENAHRIEEIAAKQAAIYLDKSMLTNRYALEKQNILEQIRINEKRMHDLGAKAPSKELFTWILSSAVENSPELQQFMQKEGRSAWHTEDLFTVFGNMYNMSTSYATTVNGKLQYHIVFISKGTDPHLHQVKTEMVYNTISPGGSEAFKWVAELLSIYAQKAISQIPIPTFLEWMPYELLVESKPNPNVVSSSGNATVVTLNTVSTQKFVFVYDSAYNDWFYALSTNRVSYATIVTQAVNIQGVAHNKSTDFPSKWINNDYYTANTQADAAFIAKQYRVLCIDFVSVESEQKIKDYAATFIHTPLFVAHMT